MIAELFFIELTVANWKHSLNWYASVLGMETQLQVEKDRFALLQVGPTRLALKEGDPIPGSMILTFEVESLDTFCQHLQAKGMVLDRTIKASEEGYRRISILDPDGYRLNFFEWSGPARRDWHNRSERPC